MPGRRHSSTKTTRDRARDAQRASLDRLVERINALESLCTENKRSLDAQLQRIVTLQAQLDHVAAKVGAQ
jgi:ribosome assembly protein YihI (activator of Der GTPase)